MAIGGAVSVAGVRHMHSTVERETDQLKNADANGKIGVSADAAGVVPTCTCSHSEPAHRLSDLRRMDARGRP
eukprot:COSAG01_NODE_62697_length_283_cov_1.043478_1_plen_72_part_01